MYAYKMVVCCAIRGFWQTTVHFMQIWSQDSMPHGNSLHLSFKYKHHHIVTVNLRCEKSQQKLLVNFDVPGVLSETIFFVFRAPAIKMAQRTMHHHLCTRHWQHDKWIRNLIFLRRLLSSLKTFVCWHEHIALQAVIWLLPSQAEKVLKSMNEGGVRDEDK